jgi:hypothetical protein
MSEIRTRCAQGTLIVTNESIRIELGKLRQQSLARSALTGIESGMAAPSVFGLGGGTNLIFHGKGGERLQANFVNPGKAEEIKRMLGY